MVLCLGQPDTNNGFGFGSGKLAERRVDRRRAGNRDTQTCPRVLITEAASLAKESRFFFARVFCV